MTETSDSTVSTPETVPVANTDTRIRPSRLYQALAWVGIVAGVLLIIGMVFFAGVFLGRTGGYGWHRGYYNGQMDPGGQPGQCPMMRGGGMGPGGMMGPGMMGPGMRGPGGMEPDDMGPGGMMGPGRSPASTAPAPPPAPRPS